MPASFELPVVNVSSANVHNDVWIPLNPPSDPAQRASAYYAGCARLKPGVTIAQASDDVKRVAAEIVKENPGRSVSYTATLFGLQDFAAKQPIDIRPGDLLLAFTDGVTDAMNPNQEAFGEERLKALVRQIADLPVSQIISRISQELRAWMRDAPQFDDLTFIVAKIKEQD
jgi:serine/threonine protein phosphatase PrpC